MTVDTRLLDVWETPSDYGGYDPVGHYGVMAVTRDSEVLERANWQAAIERMAIAAGMPVVPNLADSQPEGMWAGDPDKAPAVYWWEAGHWMCGWVQYLMVKPDAPEKVLAEAVAIRSELRVDDVLDEDLFNEMTEAEMMDEDEEDA